MDGEPLTFPMRTAPRNAAEMDDVRLRTRSAMCVTDRKKPAAMIKFD